jgi:hypothetical protein
LAKYSPYALRHYYASKLIEKGKDLKFIQHAMGHSKIEIALNVYGHLLKGRERPQGHGRRAGRRNSRQTQAPLNGTPCLTHLDSSGSRMFDQSWRR